MPIQITKRPYKLVWTGNPVHYELTSAAASLDTTIFFDIRIMFRHFVTGEPFREVVRFPFYPTGGVASFSIHNYLHCQVKWEVPGWPADPRTVQQMLYHTGEFYIQFREISTANATPNWDDSEKDYPCTAVKGGIDYFQWGGNNYWVNYWGPKKPFLTWEPSGRAASATERMFLAWLAPKNVATVHARITVTYRDGSTAQLTKTFAAKRHLVYFVPAGAGQWGLASLDLQKTIWYWEVALVDITTNPAGPEVLSEVFRYELDNRWNLNDDVALLYRNSLGGTGSFAVRGLLEQVLDYQFTEQIRTYLPDYYSGAAVSAQKLMTECREQLTWKGDVGYLGKEHQDRLRDAQLIREVYTPGENQWIPVNITTRNLSLRKSDSMRFSMPIEFTLASEGADFYTPKSVKLGAGVLNSNVCLAILENFQLVSKDFDSPHVIPGLCECTFVASEYDPQNASAKFRYRVDGSPWQDMLYSALPLVVMLPVDGQFTIDVQGICGDDLPGKKYSYHFHTYRSVLPPPPPFPIVVSEVFNSGTPGSTRNQRFEYTGVGIADILPINVKLSLSVYGVTRFVTSTGTESLDALLGRLAILINNTTAYEWNAAGAAPPSNTPGFKPIALHFNGTNTIVIIVNFQNQFTATAGWA
jgi:hypothetical protein